VSSGVFEPGTVCADCYETLTEDSIYIDESLTLWDVHWYCQAKDIQMVRRRELEGLIDNEKNN